MATDSATTTDTIQHENTAESFASEDERVRAYLSNPIPPDLLARRRAALEELSAFVRELAAERGLTEDEFLERIFGPDPDESWPE